MMGSRTATFAQYRNMMVADIARRGVHNRAVLDAMLAVPREAFVPPQSQEEAYSDRPLRIPSGQTISQPFIVAVMLAASKVSRTDVALEVGAGSGYAAAVMSRIARKVYAVERHRGLAASAGTRLRALGYANISIRAGDGTKGWPEKAPFDVIVISASAQALPPQLCRQLAIGGRMIIPLKKKLVEERLVRIVRQSTTHYEMNDLGAVRFVPLVTAD